MTPTCVALASVAAATVGFAALCLGMARHRRQSFPHNPESLPRPGKCRAAGSMLVVLSAAFCLMGLQWDMALVTWAMSLTVAAMTVVVSLTYWPSAILLVLPTICLAIMLAAIITMI